MRTDALTAYRAVAVSYCRWLSRCGSVQQAQVADCTGFNLRTLTRGVQSEGQLGNYTVEGSEACASGFDALACDEPQPPVCSNVLYGTAGAVPTGSPCVRQSCPCGEGA